MIQFFVPATLLAFATGVSSALPTVDLGHYLEMSWVMRCWWHHFQGGCESANDNDQRHVILVVVFACPFHDPDH